MERNSKLFTKVEGLELLETLTLFKRSKIKIFKSQAGTEFGLWGNMSQADVVVKLFQAAIRDLNKVELFKSLPKAMPPLSFVLVQLPEDWLFNWSPQNKLFEVNITNVPRRPQFYLNFFFSLGVAYYDLGLKAAQKKYWYSWIRKDKSVVEKKTKKMLSFYTESLGLSRYAFGVGWLSWCIKGSPYFSQIQLHSMIEEFLTGKLGQEDISENPLGVQLNPERFTYFDSWIKEVEEKQEKIYKTKKFSVQDSNKTFSMKEILDTIGAADYIHAILEHIKDTDLSSNFGYSDFDALLKNIKFKVKQGHTGKVWNLSIKLKQKTSGYSEDVFEVQREFTEDNFGKFSIYNDYCLAHEDIQGLGLGMKMTQSQLAMSLQSKVNSIDVLAAGEVGDDWTGYFVWPKFGFDGLITLGHFEYKVESVKKAASAYYQISAEKMLQHLGELDALEIFETWAKDSFSKILVNGVAPDDELSEIVERAFGAYMERKENEAPFDSLLRTIKQDSKFLERYFTKDFFDAFVRDLQISEESFSSITSLLSPYDLSIREQRVQALLEVKREDTIDSSNDRPKHGLTPVGAHNVSLSFADWWEKKGGSELGLKMDLSKGAYSLPFLIMDLYRKKKIAQGKLLSRKRKVAGQKEVLLTRAGGAFLKEDIALLTEVRDEVMQMLRTQKSRVASLWLSSYMKK